MKTIFIFWFLGFICFVSFGQIYKMSDGETKMCHGYFYDSGGPYENYKDGETKIFTISSENDQSISISFSAFEVAENDWLEVYDGKSTDAKLINKYTKHDLAPFLIKSSGNSLTFIFHSEKGNSGAGWKAEILCDQNLSEKKIGKNEIPKILSYSIRGVKSDADKDILNKILMEKPFVLETSFNLKNESLWVTAADAAYTYEIKDLLLSASRIIDYEIYIDFIEFYDAKKYDKNLNGSN